MRFAELDARMRAFETAQDQYLAPDAHLLARLDGRSFTRLTKDVLDLERPFDERFRDAMLATAAHLTDVGLRVTYAYTESDEISLLLADGEAGFKRKVRKLNSILAGEASACFSLAIGRIATFDCRLIELPTRELVIDYFRWRQEDAVRNALTAYCYWKQRAAGRSPTEASALLSGASLDAKRQLLLEHGVRFDDTPSWQRLGVGLYWDSYDKGGTDPRSGARSIAKRRRLTTDLELPRGQAYAAYVDARFGN